MWLLQLKTKTQYKLKVKCAGVKSNEGQNLVEFLILQNFDKE